MPSQRKTSRPGTHRTGRPRADGAHSAANQTLVTGLNIFQSVSNLEAPATLTELAHKNGMSITTIARYLAGLTETGFLQQDKETGKFDLGPAAMRIGVATLARLDTVRLATDVLRELTESTGHAAILSVWSATGPVVIKCEQGRLDWSVRVREGVYASVAVTAAGRIFLAYWNSDELAPVLARDLKDWNQSAPADQRLTLRDIDATKQDILDHGLARATALHRPSIAALAAPIFGRDHQLLMSMTLVGMVGTMETSYTGEPARTLKATTSKLSQLFGALPQK
jgi:DNA-binding IclR family transcriptional regulator